MDTIRNDRFKRRLAKRVGDAALRIARPKVNRSSTTLARAMRVKVVRIPGDQRNVKASVHIPHYWAVFVHDGRNPFSKSRFMVFFRNPRLDPRLQGGKTPRRASQLRPLGQAGFERAKQLLRDHRRAGGSSIDAPVTFTKTIRKPTAAARFFDNRSAEGMAGFDGQANQIGSPLFSRHVKATLGENFDRRGSITVRL